MVRDVRLGESPLTAEAVRALRYGPRSMQQAVVAATALGALALVHSLVPGSITRHSAMAGAYLLVPLLQLAGVVFAVFGLIHAPKKRFAGFGLALNLLVALVACRLAMAVVEGP